MMSKMNPPLSHFDNYCITEREFKTWEDENKVQVKDPDHMIYQTITSDNGRIPIELNSESPIVLRVINNSAVGTRSPLPFLEEQRRSYVFSYFGKIISQPKECSHFLIKQEEQVDQSAADGLNSTSVCISRIHQTQDQPNSVEMFKSETFEMSLHNSDLIDRKKFQKGVYQCNICDRFLSCNRNLKQHLSMHTGEKPFVCLICGMRFFGKSACSSHERRHTGENSYKCETCGKHLSSKWILSKHALIHTRKGDHTCETCGKCFNSKSSLLVHINEVHKIYRCKTCGKSFTSASIFRDHKSTHPGEKVFECKTRGRHFPRKSDLQYKCETCGKSFPFKSHLNDHNKSNHIVEKLKLKPYPCEICGKRYGSNWYVRLHAKVHVKAEGQPNTCEICGMSFALKSGLDHHKESHVEEKPLLKCEACGKFFFCQDRFARHQHRHEKPHQCEICGKCYHHKSLLDDHLRSHTGEKPFTCKMCGKSFTSKSNMSHHARVHGGEHKCGVCCKSFSSKVGMEAHCRVLQHYGTKSVSDATGIL